MLVKQVLSTQIATRVKSCDLSPPPLLPFAPSLSVPRKEHSVWEEDSRCLIRIWITKHVCTHRATSHKNTTYWSLHVLYTVYRCLSSFVCPIQTFLCFSASFFSFHLTSAMFPRRYQVGIHLLIELTVHTVFSCVESLYKNTSPTTLQRLACKPIPLNVSSLILILNLIHLLITITLHIIPALGPS